MVSREAVTHPLWPPDINLLLQLAIRIALRYTPIRLQLLYGPSS